MLFFILQLELSKISHLNPRPGEGFGDKFQVVIPDVIIREDGEDWLITTNDGGIPELRISKTYQEQLENGIFKRDSSAKLDAPALVIHKSLCFKTS